METKYLRKIILEELQKVLKEEPRPKGYPYDTDPFGGQGPIDPSQAPLGSPLNPRDSAPYVDPQYVRSKPKPKRRPLKKSFTEKEIVDLSLNPKRMYSGHKAKYTTASGEVYSIKFDQKGKPDYATVAFVSAPKAVASGGDTGGTARADAPETPVPSTGIDPKMKGNFTPEEEQKIMDYYKTLPGPKESLKREINKLLKML